jgi:two-component system sensor histidine kinase/response regulator
MESLQSTNDIPVRYRSSAASETFDALKVRFGQLFLHVKFLGYSHTMDDYEQRKLRIFNQINFFQLLAGLLVPLLGMALHSRIQPAVWAITCSPAAVSFVVLVLNYFRRYEFSLYAYFILYPLCTCLIYLNGVNPGTELSFILFVILSVFFLHDEGFMLFSIGFSIISFFVLSVLLKHYTYEVESESPVIYLLNKSVSLAFIFYGLVLVKKKNAVYQFNILSKQKHLAQKNAEIERQKEELASLNAFKSKLFSIISHDLRSPIYALRNLFQNVQQYDLPAEEMKAMVPDVLKDLNYTTSLMENLLQWAKSQMQASAVNLQTVNTAAVVKDVANLLRLQVEAKKIQLRVQLKDPAMACADKDMLHLVLRNLLSNAVKFTPQDGIIEIGLNAHDSFVEIYVKDSGVGISKEALEKIRQQIFYTTTGTGSETGTGLGLMLCHEFLLKNGSRLQIESTVGEGSVFSFTLPKVSA